MTDPVTPQRSRWRGRLFYAATILVTVAVTYEVVALGEAIDFARQGQIRVLGSK